MNYTSLTKIEPATPYLWVDLECLEQNILALEKHLRSAGVQWRPHIKGIKVPEIAHLAMKAGAIGITCAKLSEAEVMAAAGIDHILIANQIVGEAKTNRLANLCRNHEIIVAVDNQENVARLGESAVHLGTTIGVVVEVDVGMHRSGVQPGGEAVRLSQRVQETQGLKYQGLMGWEGQATTIEDPVEREQIVRESIGLLTKTADACRDAGLTVSIVSAGGSATLDTTPFLPGLTEIQAGGAMMCDVYYESMQSVTVPALSVRCTVTSHPVPERLIIDAGFKALPAFKCSPRPNLDADVATINMSAEHGTIRLHSANDTVDVGDTIDLVVGYSDQTVFLHDKLIGVRNGTIEVVWDIQARGKLT